MPVNVKAPQAVLTGVNDLSRRTPPEAPILEPSHLPLFFLLTQKSERIVIGDSVAATAAYGDKTFDPNGDFYNHQTVFSRVNYQAAGQAMIVPIKLDSAKRAGLRIGVEVAAATVDGVNVTRFIMRADQIDEDGDEPIREAMVKTEYRAGDFRPPLNAVALGELVSDGKSYYAPSAYYPLIDLMVEARGSYGNDIAISLEAPSIFSARPADTSLIDSLNVFGYRLALYEKSADGTNAVIKYNNYSEVKSDFVLKPDFVHPRTKRAMSFGEVIIEDYQQIDDASVNNRYSPFTETAVYQDNIEDVAMLIAAGHTITAEADDGTTKDFTIAGVYPTEEEADQKKYAINIFTGRDVGNQPYPNADFVNSRIFGGVRLGDDSVIYARGGDDGFPKLLGVVDKHELLRIFEAKVIDWCNNYTPENPVFDSAKYHFTTLWDSGFGLNGKFALIKPVAQHKRINAMLSVYSIADYMNPMANTGWAAQPELSGAEELSMAMTLRAQALLTPEASDYGTPCMRVAIIGRSGTLIDRTLYRGKLPLAADILYKVANYMGAGDGIWRSEYAFDQSPANKVEIMRDINVVYQSPSIYDKSWDAGLIYPQSFDTTDSFFAAFTTVYPDDTSILKSLITMMAISNCEHFLEVGWRRKTGNSKLTNDEFAEANDEMMSGMVKDRFDDRFKIIPETYFTATDIALGKQWHTDLHFYGNNSKTVGVYRINAYRMSDLEE